MKNNRLAQLREFLKAEPDDPFLKYGIAQEYLAMDDLANANAQFEGLFQSHPDYLPTYYHYGKLKWMLGDSEGAEKLFRAGLELAKTQQDRRTANELAEILEDLLDE